jgi:16S rRNA (cytidine1402-2'-O)-methyltransferase
MKNGTLYLIPTLLGDSDPAMVMPAKLGSIITSIKHFVVEDLRTARRFLKKVDRSIDIDTLSFSVLNEHSNAQDIPDLIKPSLRGHDMGIMSEAGTPCVADPGAALVSIAHEKGIKVIPLSGPSSIIMALMASGFNGQNFAFHGYIPIEDRDRNHSIKQMETAAFRHDQTQIFIETPYRNMKLFEAIVSVCMSSTRLCIAANLTTTAEMISTKTINGWKKNPPAINKQPAVFLLYK